MWEGSRETLETVDRRAGNNKRIHDVNVGKIHGCYDCCLSVNQAKHEVDGTNKFPAQRSHDGAAQVSFRLA